jgi:hypothetical protein
MLIRYIIPRRTQWQIDAARASPKDTIKIVNSKGESESLTWRWRGRMRKSDRGAKSLRK